MQLRLKEEYKESMKEKLVSLKNPQNFTQIDKLTFTQIDKPLAKLTKRKK
jgi:hypothetical protein